MNKVLTFGLLILFPFLLTAQTQVSNIEFHKKIIDQPRKGFIPIGDEEYFIEQGARETKISLIKDDELELQHIVDDRPFGFYYGSNRVYHADYVNSNSGLLYDGHLLYELYPSHIYAIDILSGQVDHKIDIGDSIRIHSGFFISDDHYYFVGIRNGGGFNSAYFDYDRQQGTLTKIEASEGTYLFPYRIDKRLYFYGQSVDQILSYDLTSGTLDTVITASSGLLRIKSIPSNGKQQLLLTEGDTSSVYIIDYEHNLRTLDCLEGTNPDEVYLMSDLLFFTKLDNDSIYVMDRQNCDLVASYLFPTHLSFRDSRELYGEYVLLSNVANWSGRATFFIYDIAQKAFTEIAPFADSPYMDRAVRYDNTLYLIVWDDIHYIGILPKIVALDLETKLISRIDDYDIEGIHNVVIGEHRNDQTVRIYYDTEEESVLWSYQHREQERALIHQFDYLKDVGLSSGFYAHIWHDDQLFFYCRDALYVLADDQTTKILDSDSYLNNFSSAGFIIEGGKLHTMLGQDSAVYKITVDLEDFSYQRQLMPGMDYLDYRRPVTEYALVNVPNGYQSQNTGYYSLKDGEFKPFLFNGQIIQPFEFTVSGNNILLDNLSSDESFLFDTETETAVITEIPARNYPNIYPDGEGGFYLVRKSPNSSSSIDDLMHMDTEGKLTSIMKDFSYHQFYDSERLDGKVKSVAFDGDGEMIILSAKGADYKLTSIPDEDLIYYNPQGYFWRETDQLSVLEVPAPGFGYDTYIFSFIINPIKITTDSKSERLVEAWIEQEKVVLLYWDRFSGDLSFVDYEFATAATTLRQSINVSGNFSSHFINYEDHKYMISLNDGIHGEEPWLYNSETGSLELLKDMQDGFDGSIPRQYIVAPNSRDVYFTALSNRHSRQFFKLDQTVSTSEIEDLSNTLIVSPSPTKGPIQLNQNLSDLQIYNLNGQVVYQANYYSKDEELHLGSLANGLYYVVGVMDDGNFCGEKFVIGGE